MQSHSFFNRRMLISLVLLINGFVQAEMPFTWIAGLYAVTKDNHYLSPINGLVWYQQNIVKNMYDIWAKQPDTMKDNTIQLVQEIFYLQRDGVSFLPTKRLDKPAHLFMQSTVGSIIKMMQQYRLKTINRESFVNQLQTIIRDSVASGGSTVQKKEALEGKRASIKKINEINKAIKDLNAFLIKKTIDESSLPTSVKNYYDKGSKKRVGDELRTFLTNDTSHKLKEALTQEELKVGKFKNDKAQAKEDDRLRYDITLLTRVMSPEAHHNLANLIVGSVDESSDNNKRYILYTTEQILLAFLWAKSDTREDFEAFFNALGQQYVNQNALINWMSAKLEYTREDYETFQENFANKDAKTIVQFVGEQYETAVFAVRAYQMWYQVLPFIFTGTTVEYKKDGNIYTFADCGETSLRNFFDIILKNLSKGKFDIDYLLNAKSVEATIPLKVSGKLAEFYTKNFSFNNVTSLQLYNDWTHVVEDLPDVRYVDPENAVNKFYEIDVGMTNVLQVLNSLLFDNNESFKQLSNTEKLNLICKQLSRADFNLSWRAVDDQDEPVDVNTKEFLTLKFTIETHNKKVFFEWKFEERHFVLSSQSTTFPIATDKVDAIANSMNYCKPDDTISVYSLLGCYANRDNFESLCSAAGKALSSNQLVQLMYCFYDIRSDWGIWFEELRGANRARMILGIAKNTSDDTDLVNFFISNLLKEWIVRSRSEAQVAMAQELLRFNYVHAGSLPFIVDTFSNIIQNIDIRTFPGIASFMQKLEVKDDKQALILMQLIALMVKDNVKELFPIAIKKNE